MLTLKLTLDNGQVTVRANEAQSHSFSLHDLRLNDAELKAFALNPRLYGSRLFQALFEDGSAAKTAFDELSKQTARTIVLVLDSPVLDSVAWEYAYNEVKQEYVVEDCAFMRALSESERPANGRLKESVERVSLLFIPANPLVDLNAEPMRALDVDGEWREMTRHITASHAPFDLLQLRPATPEQLQTSMARFRDGLVVHFSGHGAAMNDGTILLFERENGASNPLGAQEFIRTVKDKAEIVFLSACQSAAAEKTEFGNLARGLVKSGVPFALGMQFNLPDPFAPVISGQFYNWLAQGHAIPEATMQARRAVKRENEFFVGMIALYAAHPDETGKLDWRGSSASLVQMARPADVSDLPSPASGLIGRQRELMRIGTQLIEEKRPLTVTLHGAGGIGKTALLWQSLLRFAPSFDLTLALALDPLPSLESILGRIERFLGLPSPCANETKERETLLRERLTSKRTLLGLDNFETLNYALNEKDSDEEKTSKSLLAFFKSLAANGVTLCVTSREVTNLPGETIEDIQGLTNENGGRLFQENVVRQKDEIYIEKTQQVSEMVGGHPLALRLLASAFDDQVGTSMDQYIEDLQSHLPKARDKWTEENRHESLRASFDFTMNNLVKTEEGKGLQVALSRLSLFISFFVDFTAASVLENHLPKSSEEEKTATENAQTTLQTLWKHGLLECTVRSVQNENLYLYRLHPSLSIFARESITEWEVLKENYWQAMNTLARIADKQIIKSTLFAQIASAAIPDLLAAADSKYDQDAALMNFRVGKILQHFGLLDDSLHLLEKSHAISNSFENRQAQSATMHEMAYVYTLRGDLDQAKKLYQHSFKILENTDDQQNQSHALFGIANIVAMSGNLDDAMKSYQQILQIVEDLDDLNGKAAVLHQMANIIFRRGDLKEAMRLHQQTLQIWEGLGDLKGKSQALDAMAGLFLTFGNLKEAMKSCQQSLEIREGLGDLKGQCDTLRQMAVIHVRSGELNGAMNSFQQALEISENLGFTKGKSTILHEMAGIYRMNGDLDKAMNLYQKSLDIVETLGYLEGKSATLHEMAYIYRMQGDLDKAMNLYKESLEIAEKLNYPQGKSATLHMMASIFVMRGDLDGAMRMYQQALQIDTGLGDLNGKSTTFAMLGQLWVQKKDYSKAISSLFESWQILSSIGARPDIERVAEILENVRQLIGPAKFDALWIKEFGQPIPGWLAPKEKRGIFSRLFKR